MTDSEVSRSGRVSWRTLLLIGGAILGAACICSILYLREAGLIVKNLQERELTRPEVYSKLMMEELHSVAVNLQVLGDGDGLKAYLVSEKDAELKRAIHRAVFFSKLQPDYDQLRYLDEKGQERFRVERSGKVGFPREDRENLTRPYFFRALDLKRGQVFMSAFELNVEDGKIEQPLKPIIHFSTPVFDEAGRRRGVYVVNYLAASLFDRMRQTAPVTGHRLRILNATGYWLKNIQPQLEWGFMLPDRKDATLGGKDPVLWNNVIKNTTGQVAHGGGLFTWKRVMPQALLSTATGDVITEEPFLIIASEVPAKEWSEGLASVRRMAQVGFFILLPLLVASLLLMQSRRRAREERDRFFNLTRDMLCIAGFDGYFKRVNPAWEKVLGYTSQEMLSRPFLELTHPDDRELTIKESAMLAQGHETVFFENRYRCKDGTYRWLLWSARGLVEDKLVVASARDITNHKRDEQEIRKLNTDLRIRAAELEESNRELEAFSYSVSHDLRAPLRHIMGFAEILEESIGSTLDATNRKYLSTISSAALRMGKLIDDLLTFSRTGRAELNRVTTNLDKVVAEAVQNLQQETAGRSIVWDIAPLPAVHADPALLRQVFINVIGNAIKYTRRNLEAHISIGVVPGNAGEVVVFVRDDGVGFDMKYVGKLFGVFERLHAAGDFEGTGVGLANVRRVIERHGGRVWAESGPGPGATFYLALPSPLY